MEMIKHHIFYIYIAISIFVLSTTVKAQDASFSQHYASPLYLSPSFTGLTDGSRLAMSYRDQYPGVSGVYKTMAFSFDHYFADYNSGVGLLYYRDDQGGGQIIDQNVGLTYAYEIYVSDQIMIRPGIQFKFAQIGIDPSNANLGGQIGPDGNPVPGAGLDVTSEIHSQFDAAASLMIYSSNFWGGVTVDHLVKQNISFTDEESYRGMKFTAFGGTKWIYKEGRRGSPDQSVSFAFNYRQQQSFKQLDIGAYWMYNPLEIGLWYRGLPMPNEESLSNHDAIIAILGVHFGSMRFGYSYDLTISDLASNTGGAHEFSIMYTIPASNKPRINRRAVPCSQPGYGGGGASRSKYRSRSRRIF